MIHHLPLLAKLCAWLGVILRIIAYQFSRSPHGAPEWVFNLDSVGFFIESLWPVCMAFSTGRRISEFIMPAGLFAYVVMFDACKELSGANQSKTGMELVLFWFFFVITFYLLHYVKDRHSQVK